MRTDETSPPAASIDEPLVFIVVLNWNCWEDTVACVASASQMAYRRYKVVVVDNGSTDGSECRIRDACPHVEVIQTGANLGYAGGNNIGIERALAAGADYVLVDRKSVV